MKRLGLSPLQKCTMAIHMIEYGTPADQLDDYLKIGGSTSMWCLEMFTQGVIDMYGGLCLRHPTYEDVEHLLQVGNP